MVIPIILGIVGSIVAGGAYMATRRRAPEAPPGVPPGEPAKETEVEKAKREAAAAQKKKVQDAIKFAALAVTAVVVSIKVIKAIKADQSKRYGEWIATRYMVTPEERAWHDKKQAERSRWKRKPGYKRASDPGKTARLGRQIGAWRETMVKKYAAEAGAADFRKRLLVVGRLTEAEAAKKQPWTAGWIKENRKAVDGYLEASDKAKAEAEKALREKARLVLLEKAAAEAARPRAEPGQDMQLMEGEAPTILPAVGRKWVRGAVVSTAEVEGKVFRMYRWKQVATESALAFLVPRGGRMFALEEE